MRISAMTPEQQKQRRAQWRSAARKSRSKKKSPFEAQQAEHERYVRASRNPHFYGEVSPGCDAQTLKDELQIHREFLRALGKPDVQLGETLRAVAKRTYEAWAESPSSWKDYRPAFNRTLQMFDPDFGFEVSGKPFEEIWEPPKGCSGDEPLEALPGLPEIPDRIAPKLEPQLEPEIISETTNEEILARGGMQLLRQLQVESNLAQEAQEYLNRTHLE